LFFILFKLNKYFIL